MLHDPAWILSHIPNPHDRKALMELVHRYEIIRLHLLRPADPVDAEALRDRVAYLEAKLEEWHDWADKNIPVHEELVIRYNNLLRRCIELEGENEKLRDQAKELLRQVRPRNDILYQDAL